MGAIFWNPPLGECISLPTFVSEMRDEVSCSSMCCNNNNNKIVSIVSSNKLIFSMCVVE